MNLDKVFANLGDFNKELFERISGFAETINIFEQEQEFLTRDESAKYNCLVNTILSNTIAVGSHLARVTKEKQLLENEKEKLFGRLYGEVTDECVANKNSSKFDQPYRTGKVINNPEYQKIVKVVAEITELQMNLETVLNSQKSKGMTLNTLIKTDLNG